MDNNEVLAWALAFFVVGLCAMGIRYEARLNEVMARDGYVAYRLPGSTDIYWSRKDEPDRILLGPKSF